MKATSSTRLSLKGGAGEEEAAVRAHWSMTEVTRLSCLGEKFSRGMAFRFGWKRMLSHPPAHAVVLSQRLRQHGAYPGAVEFLFDEVWVCDGADSAHEEHLGIVQHAAE
jgi:hypothetical protein